MYSSIIIDEYLHKGRVSPRLHILYHIERKSKGEKANKSDDGETRESEGIGARKSHTGPSLVIYLCVYSHIHIFCV